MNVIERFAFWIIPLGFDVVDVEAHVGRDHRRLSWCQVVADYGCRKVEVREVNWPDASSGRDVENSSSEAVGQGRIVDTVLHGTKDEVMVDVETIEFGLVVGRVCLPCWKAW